MRKLVGIFSLLTLIFFVTSCSLTPKDPNDLGLWLGEPIDSFLESHPNFFLDDSENHSERFYTEIINENTVVQVEVDSDTRIIWNIKILDAGVLDGEEYEGQYNIYGLQLGQNKLPEDWEILNKIGHDTDQKYEEDFNRDLWTSYGFLNDNPETIIRVMTPSENSDDVFYIQIYNTHL